MDLCPRCAKREIEPGAPSGWCSDCVIENIRETYGEKQRAASLGRRESWSETAGQSWDRDRQRVSRLRRAIQPKESPTHEDPWAIAYEALSTLNQIRSVKMRAEQHARLDLIAEALRRLAWGPDDQPKGTDKPVLTLVRGSRRKRVELPGQLALFDVEAIEAAA